MNNFIFVSTCFAYFKFDFRNRFGCNTNPNAIEFRSAYKRLLACHPMMTSVDHNVITNATGILTASSRPRGNKRPFPLNEEHQSLDIDLACSYEDLLLEEIDGMDPFDQHMCAFLASSIEEQVSQNVKLRKYKCKICADVLSNADDRIDDDLLALQGKRQPSMSTFKLVIFSNAVMKMCSADRPEGNEFRSVCRTICENVDIDDVYSNFHTYHEPLAGYEQGESAVYDIDHKQAFVFQIMNVYMTMKSKQICKKINLENPPRNQ